MSHTLQSALESGQEAKIVQLDIGWMGQSLTHPERWELTMLLTPYSMVWDCRILRAGPMFFYWPKLLYLYNGLLLGFPLSTFSLLVGIVGLGSSDR